MTQEQANWEWMDARVKKLEEHCFSIKTLTDEEIRQIYIETMESPFTHYQCFFGFARAILRKANNND